jgi:hypothetical protein
MKRPAFILIMIGILITFGSCDKIQDTDLSTDCDRKVLISSQEFLNAPADPLSIVSVELTGDYLKIQFASSGCDGSNWEVKLIDSGAVMYSDPPQRNIRLSLKNPEMCEAYIGKSCTFDISDLQLPGNKVLLNLINSGTQVLYEVSKHN